MRPSLLIFPVALLTACATVEVESSLPADECGEMSSDVADCALSALQLKTQKHLSEPGSFSVALSTEDGAGHVTEGEQAKHQRARPASAADVPSSNGVPNGQPQLLDEGSHRSGTNACCLCASGDVGFSSGGACGFCQGQVKRTEPAPADCHLSLLDASARTRCAERCGKQFRRKSWYPEGLNL
mmetsp:Transcript_17195/g.32406  ORF Transcript_17195/g.32406 Transcript_17195/m.32406 type:complete len:184 (+) Transcript_17195:107-658(+)